MITCPRVHFIYAYDGTGTRIGKTVNGVSTGQIWNNGNVIAEYGTKGTKTYIRGAGAEIVKTKDSTNNNRYFSYNAHGDTTNIIEKKAESTSFAVTAAYEYDAFGGWYQEQAEKQKATHSDTMDNIPMKRLD